MFRAFKSSKTNGLSPFSILLYIASVIITESSVIIPIAKIKLKRTKIFIDNSKKNKDLKKMRIKLTGRAIAGTITAFIFPKKKINNQDNKNECYK